MAVIWTVLVGFVSLGVDWGRVQLVKTQLQRASDAAARAAVVGLRTNVATARSMAVTWAAKNTADGWAVVVDPNNDVEFGIWSSTTRTFTVVASGQEATANCIRVTARRTTARGNAVPLMFASVIGRSSCDCNGISVATTRTALFIVGSTTLSSSDQAQADRLVSLGYNVIPITDASCLAGDATGMALVLISESVTASTLGVKMRDVTVPVVCCEGNSLGNMKMTGPTVGTDCNDVSTYTQVTITNSAHVLAAGLSGTQTVYPDGWGEMNVGITPSASATKIAYATGNSSWWAIFGYDTSTSMHGGYTAPARRVGLFFRQPDISHTNTNAWKLFDATVKWAVGDI